MFTTLGKLGLEVSYESLDAMKFGIWQLLFVCGKSCWETKLELSQHESETFAGGKICICLRELIDLRGICSALRCYIVR